MKKLTREEQKLVMRWQSQLLEDIMVEIEECDDIQTTCDVMNLLKRWKKVVDDLGKV